MADPLTKEELQAHLDATPFARFCRIRLIEVDYEKQSLTMVMPMREEFERSDGTAQMHGGPIAALVDTAGCFACVMMLGYGVPTINFRTDYFRPVFNSGLKAVASVRRIGRRVAVSDVDVFDDQGKLVAVGRATFGADQG